MFTRNNQIVSRATIQATGTNSLDQFAPGLVNLYAANKDLFTLLLPVIKKEVSSTGKYCLFMMNFGNLNF